jgi:protein-S-isoprenylcysteine O-methyltransferase Ste14
MTGLAGRAVMSLVGLFLATAALLFGPPWTVDYWQAWVFLAVYFGGSAVGIFYLLKKDPALLERRMRGGPFAEERLSQKITMAFTSAGFIGLLVIPALDRRYGWSHLPPALALAGDAVVLLGGLAVGFVFRANSFTSATIELAPDQRVISTGPYARVRHPMYVGALVMMAGIPIALGSGWGLLALAAMMPALVWRIFDEEKFLTASLPGYTAYRQEVQYRLIPHVW